ncbi:MAG: hypothetical protein KDA61_15595 [Planctomycetales bacterium]|nr:hypothetical protein [Planctomycetales bacterium]
MLSSLQRFVARFRRTLLGCLLVFGGASVVTAQNPDAKLTAPDVAAISPAEMQAVYEEAKTPYKYGVVIEPKAEAKVDCPNVFRFEDKWYMIYVELQPNPEQGYTTELAVSDDLLHWKKLGTILPRGPEGAWDSANSGGGVALFDPTWGGGNGLQTYEGRYWLTYLGGNEYGYEKTPLSIGLAWTEDPANPSPWRRLEKPILRSSDADARPGEKDTLYKSTILHDETQTLGAPFVMYYNAKPPRGSEQIFAATSHDLRAWKRVGDGPVVENHPQPGATHGVISGDPQIVRMNDMWVMYYFGAFWKEGAFDTFAASRDLLHWTQWDGPNLIDRSEPYDDMFAHKPWLVKHDGIVYHFYCAVGGKRHHRTIAVATSRDMKTPEAVHAP